MTGEIIYNGISENMNKALKETFNSKVTMEEELKISKETLRGVYLILSGISSNHTGSEKYPKAIPIMNKAHKKINEMAESFGFDCRGGDIE